MTEEYPSNSKRDRDREEQQSTPLAPVAKGRRMKRHVPLLARIFGENAKSVGDYILWDVLVPAVKSTFSDIISNGIEMLLYGESKGRNIRRDRGRSYVSYQNYYSKDRDRATSRRRERIEVRDRHRFDDVILDYRDEAEQVLTTLVELIENYHIATVGDFYDLVGLESSYTDRKYGWDSLGRASVKRVRDGYILVLPDPLPID